MTAVVEFGLLLLAGCLAVPVAMFVIEVLAALVLPERRLDLSDEAARRPTVAVLVPAHDESIVIRTTLEDIKSQLRGTDRLVVVADNCADDTALVASASGAEVIERNQPARIGKGFALDFGLKHLISDPPEVVIVIDADCRLAVGTIDLLAKTCARVQRPVQSLDLMMSPGDSTVNYRVAEFAWRVKNWVRPLGLNALGLPCQLMGTGMAFPWDVIGSTDFATESIVEDMTLGLDLAQQGAAPFFCPSASVSSEFPISVESAGKQRQRWEEGHIRLIFSKARSYFFAAIAQRNLNLFALTLDLTIPPLSALVILLSVELLVTGLAAFFGITSAASFVFVSGCIMALAMALFSCWVKWGRDLLPPTAIFSVASYLFGKLPIYRRMLYRNRAPRWIRTDRNESE